MSVRSHIGVFCCLLVVLFLSFTIASAETTPPRDQTTPEVAADLAGVWDLVPVKSSDIGHFRSLTLRIEPRKDAIKVVQIWRARVTVYDSVTIRPGANPVDMPIRNWVFPTNVFMGLRMSVGETRRISARWEQSGTLLRIEEQYPLLGSQGKKSITVVHRFELSKEHDIMFYSVQRSSRKTGPEVKYTLKKSGSRQAYFVRLEDDWNVTGKLGANAMWISLQGLANKSGPLVYLLYPDNWPFTYVNSVFDFYKDKRYFTFKELKTPADALKALGSHVKGYVVWDTAVRTSLIVAFTVAGLEEAVVVTEDLVPVAEKAGLKPVEDLRGKFVGMNDAQIYSWAYDRYWNRCSKEYIIWLGGEHGSIMKPAVADWGIRQKVFFNDLSSRPSDSVEYALAKKLLAEMKPMSMVMGWHSYKKDLEEEHVTLTSSYGHRVEGLNSLPNLSFGAQVPATPGFVYKNNHHLKPGERPVPGKKVYVSCIQTDGIGLGAWLKPGRGEIPYAWEVLMNYTWMAPGMIEYFYTMATPNDYFIGCLSGPGYLYPKAVPKQYLPKLIAMAREQMKTLDLRVFETMDWSEGSEVEGNTDLPKSIIDMYYEGMPEALGFVNGYGPGHTFTSKGGKPFVSYDYYLSPSRPEADAVADLQELADINDKRPYFLLVHVREYSDVKRVKGILDKLGSDFEVVPLDVFLAMAGVQPTYEERMLNK
jgi:hypothetical protein